MGIPPGASIAGTPAGGPIPGTGTDPGATGPAAANEPCSVSTPTFMANLSGDRHKEIEQRHGQQLVSVFAPKGRRIIAQGAAGLPAKPWDAGEISTHRSLTKDQQTKPLDWGRQWEVKPPSDSPFLLREGGWGVRFWTPALHKMPTDRVGIEDAPGGLVEVLTFLLQSLCLAKSQIDLGRLGPSPLCPSPPEGREETPVADSRSTQSLDCRRERAGRQRGGRTLRARGWW